MMQQVAVVTAALLSPLALADTIETITVTATHLENQKGAVATSVDVIDADQIVSLAAMSSAEVLNAVAGVYIAQGSGQEYLPSIRSATLTGAGACGSLLTSADGIAVRAAGFCNVNEMFDTQFETAQFVEVIKGPSSITYGANAQLGVVNVVGLSPALEQNSELSIRLDTLGAQAATITRTGEVAGYATALSMVAKHDDGFRESSGYTLNKGRLSVEHDSGVEVIVQFADLDQQTAGYLPGFESYNDEALRVTNPNPEAYRKATSMMWQLNMPLAIFDQNIDAKVYGRANEMDFLMHFLPGQPVEENGHWSLGSKWLVANSYDRSKWALGAQFEFSDGWLKQTQFSPTQGSAFLQATIPMGKQYDYQVDAFSGSLFGEYAFKLTQRQSVNAGVRADYQHYDYDNLMVDGRVDEAGNSCGFGGCRYTRPGDREDSFDMLSANIGWLFEFQGTQLYASYTAGHRAPQATELYRLQRAQQVAELRAERTLQAEVGIRAEYDRSNMQLSGYYLSRDNLIYRDSNFFNQSGAEIHSSGIEWMLNHRLTDSILFKTSGSYANHEYRKVQGVATEITGNQVDSAPQWVYSASLKQELSNWHHQLSYEFVDEYFTDVDNLHRYDGHALFNYSVNVDLSNKLRLGAQVLNVLDERYADRADYSGFVGDRYFPGRERRLVVTLSWEI